LSILRTKLLKSECTRHLLSNIGTAAFGLNCDSFFRDFLKIFTIKIFTFEKVPEERRKYLVDSFSTKKLPRDGVGIHAF
jgi:hypothetical protein